MGHIQTQWQVVQGICNKEGDNHWGCLHFMLLKLFSFPGEPGQVKDLKFPSMYVIFSSVGIVNTTARDYLQPASEWLECMLG